MHPQNLSVFLSYESCPVLSGSPKNERTLGFGISTLTSLVLWQSSSNNWIEKRPARKLEQQETPAKHLWQLLPEFGQISPRASALSSGMFWVTSHLRSQYHWRSDLGFFPLDLNQRTGQVLVKWPQPFYRAAARRILEKLRGIHKPER